MHRLLAPYTGRVLVACSGGADSMCLAHLAIEAARRVGQGLPALVYVDHQLRPESAAEGARVEAFARAHGCEFYLRAVELGPGASLENQARIARYEAIEALADERAFDWILTAHTRSDQAETVFMRILRGTGIVGLAGIPRHRDRFARPLLDVSRAETEAYCKERGIDYVEDAMNRDPRFARSRARHRWLPALREENPQLESALSRLASAAREQREVLDWAAAQVLDGLREGDELRLHSTCAEIPAAIFERALVLHSERLGFGALDASHIAAIRELALAPCAGCKELSLPGFLLRRSYDRLQWAPGASVPSEIHLADSRLQARHWQAGDRMRPARLRGKSRKLSDLYADIKLPRARRSVAWVVVDAQGEIVWAQHIGSAFGAKVEVKLRQPGSDDAK